MCVRARKVWEVSVKLGAEGDPLEKELAGDLALGVTLLVFEVGNSVLSVLRTVSRFSLYVCVRACVHACVRRFRAIVRNHSARRFPDLRRRRLVH